MKATNIDYIEPDCSHFSEAWLLDHPDFPLDPRVATPYESLAELA